MCGLFGFFGLELDQAKRADLLRSLARKAQARGTDSFGLVYLRDGKTMARKGLGPVSGWLANKRKEVRKVAASSLVLGHTRAASHGDVVLRNAHPFKVGGFFGAHNGGISNAPGLMTAARNVPIGETDSEEALCFLADNNMSPEAFAAVQGSWAWSIVDKEGTRLLLARNPYSPLSVAKVGRGVIWHSIAAALGASLESIGVHADVQEIEPYKLYSFPDDRCEDIPVRTIHPAVQTEIPWYRLPDDPMIAKQDEFSFDVGGEG